MSVITKELIVSLHDITATMKFEQVQVVATIVPKSKINIENVKKAITQIMALNTNALACYLFWIAFRGPKSIDKLVPMDQQVTWTDEQKAVFKMVKASHDIVLSHSAKPGQIVATNPFAVLNISRLLAEAGAHPWLSQGLLVKGLPPAFHVGGIANIIPDNFRDAYMAFVILHAELVQATKKTQENTVKINANAFKSAIPYSISMDHVVFNGKQLMPVSPSLTPSLNGTDPSTKVVVGTYSSVLI
jgi:hypothetical protein